jgi:hypothetical protein
MGCSLFATLVFLRVKGSSPGLFPSPGVSWCKAVSFEGYFAVSIARTR